MEDWFAEEGVTDDGEKKKCIVKYLDPEPEAQWKALPKFETGTFTEFKAQVMAAYPKAEEVLKGSVTALKRKIKKLGPVAADDRDDLLALVRIMTAEVVKLKNISPPIHTNRELVELFLGSLTKDFAVRVASKLSVHRLVHANIQVAEQNTMRNPEDMYDIEEVIEMAKQASQEKLNPFGKFLWDVPERTSESNVKLEEAVARLTDSINLQSQYNKQIEQRMAGFQLVLNQPRQVPQQNNHGTLMAAQPGFNRGLVPQSNHVHAGQPNGNCYYCGEFGHRIPNCQEVFKHLDLGWIVKIEGQIRLPDGSKVPFEVGKTMKQVIEALFAKAKPGLIPMSKIQDKTSLYQGNASVSTYVQAQPSQQPDDEVRVMLELVQKFGGMDRVQKVLSSQLAAEEEQWGNFE